MVDVQRGRSSVCLASLLAFIFLSCCSSVVCSDGISSYSIPFVTYGPAFANPAGVARVNATIYGGRLPYPDLSLPVLSIATPITLTGPYDAYAPILLEALPFTVDMINAHGGLFYNNSRYLLACTWASDDSSDSYLQLLYSEWLNDPSYFLFLMPPTQQQQLTVFPLVEGTNRTWTSILTLGSGVLPDYPYRFNMLPSWDQSVLATLATVNARAQLYHWEVANGTVTPLDTTVTSPFGILTIALFTHNDSSLIDQASGVRMWVNATNAARRAAGAQESDLIVIVKDVFWNIDANSVNQTLYQQSFEQCPDNLDLVIVAGEIATDDVNAVTAALAASLLRPKVAWTTSSALDYNATDPTMERTWRWWVTQSSLPILQATLPTSTFWSLTEMAGAFAYYTGALPNVGHVLTASMLDVVRAALAETASLTSDDMRAAFLGLSGATFAQNVRFNDVTGNNDASVSVAYQLQSTGLVLIQNLSQLAYPAPFPWRRTVVGDAVNISQQGSIVVVAVVISVLGCWVAQIMLEQAVYVKRRGGWYMLWLLVVAVALGGSGVWCAQFALSSALSLSIPSTGELPMQWSLPIALLAWLPALLLSWCAFWFGMRDFVDQSTDENHRGGAAYEAKQAIRHQEEEKRKRAAVDTVEHMRHLVRSVSRNVLGAAVLLTAAILLSRVGLTYVWSVQASAGTSVGAWLVSVLVCGPLVAFAVLLHFHALRYRVLAVFALAGAIMIDWQVHLTLGGFTYTSAVLSTPAALYTALLSSSSVTLLCGIVAAFTCFVFVGLQFSRMQLSRNGLSVLVATMESAIRTQRRTIGAQESELRSQRQQTDAMAKVLECIALLRPLHAQFSLALSSQANASTLRMLFDPLVDSGAGLSAPLNGTGTPTTKGRPSEIEKSDIANVRWGSRRASGAVAPAPKPRKSSGVNSQLASAPVADAENVGSSTQSSSEAVVEQSVVEPLVVDSASATTAAATEGTTETQPTVRSSISAWLAKTDNDAATTPLSPAAADNQTIALTPTEKSTQVLVARSSHHSRMSRPGRSSMSANDSAAASLLSTDPSQPIESPTSHSSSQQASEPMVAVAASVEEASGQSRTRDTHVAGWKQFESDVMSALQQHNQLASIAHPHASSEPSALSSNKRGTVVDMADFSFLLPSMASSTISRRESTASVRRPSLTNANNGCPFPTPSLQQLLQHPVCVELVKDELCRTHSEENLTFYLHAVRYRHIQAAPLRRSIAQHMHDTYIADNSSQQINVSTTQRNAVVAAMRRKGDDVCGSGLFRECEREVLTLMETNMKGWWSGVGHRMCVWLYYAVDVKRVVGWQEDEREAGAVDSRMELSRMSSVGASLLSVTRTSKVGTTTQ